MEPTVCKTCGTINPEDRTECRKCGANFLDKQQEEKFKAIPSNIISDSLQIVLQLFGWLYFIVSTILVIINIIETELFMQNIGSVLLSLFILIACLGLARVIEQNIFIIQQGKINEQVLKLLQQNK